MRRIATATCLALMLSLAACGGKDEGGNKVEMKDMEVVDGTTSDAMTDLDGVQSESAPATTATDNGSNATAPAKAAKPAAGEDSEVVADQ